MKHFRVKSIIAIMLFASTVFITSCNTQTKKETTTNKDASSEKTSTGSNYKSDLIAPKIEYAPKDGIVRIYGAGGPQTAIIRVADVYEKETGTKVVVKFGPESKWTDEAQSNADIIWGTAEQSMTAFLQTYTEFKSENVEPIYLRPAAIAVQKGNPKNIQGIEDLLKPGMRIVVVEGSGVDNTSGTGVWEDVVGRLGRLDDLKKFRKNIIDYAHGSGAGFKAFKEKNADAWITWNYWVITHPDQADLVKIEPERAIYRDLTVVTNEKADPEAKDFIEFMQGPKGVEIFKSEGWSN